MNERVNHGPKNWNDRNDEERGNAGNGSAAPLEAIQEGAITKSVLYVRITQGHAL